MSNLCTNQINGIFLSLNLQSSDCMNAAKSLLHELF